MFHDLVVFLAIPVTVSLFAGLYLSSQMNILVRELLPKVVERLLLSASSESGSLSVHQLPPDSLQQLIEPHLDEFLTVRLGKEMPMIGMFIGDKTIAQLKRLFMKELDDLFPEVMKKYAATIGGSLTEDLREKGPISQRLHLAAGTTIRPLRQRLIFIFLFLGFLIGGLQFLVSQFIF